jgi:hypothetical protein
MDLVPRRRLRGVEAPVERLDAYLLHQSGDMQPPHIMAFLT